MSEPASRQTARLSLIAALYCSQNLSLGFFTYAFLTIAQGRGVPLAAIGTAAAVGLLLTLKFLWAPLIDKVGSTKLGHYRGWLLLTQTVLGLGLALLALLDPAADFGLILGVFAVLFVAAGTQDIAADATATRLLQPSERGLGNGIQSAGSGVAQVVGGGLTLVVYHFAGWEVAAVMLALFSLLPLPFILAWKEEKTTGHLPRPTASWGSMVSFFQNKQARWWCFVLLPCYTFGFTIAYNLVRPILVDAGWDEGRIGLYVVIGGSVLGIIAGVLAGMFISRFGRKKALIGLGALQVVATFGVVPMALGNTSEWLVFAVVALANAAFSAAFAIVYTISMDLTRQESAGADFTYFTTVSSLLMVIAAALGLSLAGALGYTPVALLAGVLAILGLGVTVWKIDSVLKVQHQLEHQSGRLPQKRPLPASDASVD